ncbi:MAG: radical SAM protein [candidate division Zixibacteria bacterium]|nr:radical SAM protein [candidate division Zixibacteria bacterium]
MMLLISIIGSLIAAILLILILRYKSVFQDKLKIYKYYLRIKNTGIEEFLPFVEFRKLNILEQIVEEGIYNDEILIAGRTLRDLSQNKETILKGLKNEIHFKILILDPKIASNLNELNRLQLDDPKKIITSDLEIAIDNFHNIIKEAKKTGLKGRGILEIRCCNFIIVNSLISCLQKGKNRHQIMYNFSFSEDQNNKYELYFARRSIEDKHFCTKLHNFYKAYFNDSKLFIKYQDENIERSHDFISRYIEKDIKDLLDKDVEFEEIRNNKTLNYINSIPRIFNSLKDNKQLPNPISIQLEITNKCNTYCHHCKRHTWPKNEELSTVEIKNLLEQLGDINVKTITISGGEPFCRPDLIDILKFAKECKLNIGILTNGLDIDENLAINIIRYSDWIRISLDGSNNETYKSIRKIDRGFENVKKSITNLSNNLRKKNFSIGICYTIQRLNIDDVPDMIKFITSLKIPKNKKMLTLKFVHGRNGFLCSEDKLNELFDIISELDDKNIRKITNIDYLLKFKEKYSNINDISEGTPLKTFFEKNEVRCYTPYMFSLIDAFGDVYPCCFLYHDNDYFDIYDHTRRQYNVGNIKKTSFREIWHGRAYNDFRNNLKWININAYPECMECTQHYIHNDFIEGLYNKYKYYLDEMGTEGNNIFKEILQNYKGKKVWL